MSRTARWDFQLSRIELALTQLARSVSRHPDPIAQDNVNRDRGEIDAYLAKILIHSDEISRISRKFSAHNKSSAAIIWGAKNLIVKLRLLASEYVALQNRKMWLRLLQARFVGISKRDSLDLEAKHLIDLAGRKRQLEQLEAGLKRELDMITNERSCLKAEYAALEAADENWEASGSCQTRLGINLQHAREHASTRALSEFFRVMAVPAMHVADDAWLQEANKTLIKKADLLAHQSREMAAKLAKGEKHDEKLGIGSVKSTLKEVSDLSEDVMRRFESVRRRPLKVSRPKVVQTF
jgi:hypothetical protein